MDRRYPRKGRFPFQGFVAKPRYMFTPNLPKINRDWKAKGYKKVWQNDDMMPRQAS